MRNPPKLVDQFLPHIPVKASSDEHLTEINGILPGIQARFWERYAPWVVRILAG